MTDEEKAIATRVAESALPIFLAREVNDRLVGVTAHDNAWTVADLFIKARRSYLAQMAEKDVPVFDLTLEERDLIERGQMIPAIRALRTRTNMMLKDAKDRCERFRETTPDRIPHPS